MVFSTVSAYPRIHFTIYLEVYLGRGGILDCVSAYPLHNIPRILLGEEWYFRLRIRVSAYPLHNILRSLLGEEWYFRLRIRVSAYPLHNILLRSLLGEECYFRLRIRVSSLFRGAASKWRGILQLLPAHYVQVLLTNKSGMNAQKLVYYGFHTRIFQRFRSANVILKFVSTKEV